MTQPAKAQEPSMEEILASIRRIIADDEAKPAPQPNEPQAAKQQQPPPLAAAPPPPSPEPHHAAPPASGPLKQDDIDVMLADLDDGRKQEGDEAPQPIHGREPDILDLTEDMTAPAPGQPSFRTIGGESDVFFSEPDQEPAPPERFAGASQQRAREFDHDDSPLLSRNSQAAIDQAFHSLAHTVLVQNSRTLEDLVRDMLRPMLKSWLDDNLPMLVERLVRAEIERVSRGRT